MMGLKYTPMLLTKPNLSARPTALTMQLWEALRMARATDGCKVEPDGECEHGHISWLVQMGVVAPREMK